MVAAAMWMKAMKCAALRSKLTLNQRVQGSNPCAPTNKINWLNDKCRQIGLDYDPPGQQLGQRRPDLMNRAQDGSPMNSAEGFGL
jgi:ectoine hydroxylase-related dioxygenase (phytanoyl-CoA dioxygenase family)